MAGASLSRRLALWFLCDFCAKKTLLFNQTEIMLPPALSAKGGFMKKTVFVIFSILISMPLLAATETPNWVSCKSKDRRDTLKLVYTTTSYHGKPTFTYSRLIDGHWSRKIEADGEAIWSAGTVLGNIISAGDPNLSPPDRTIQVVSLVLPDINLIPKDPKDPDAEDPEVEFETVVVETTSTLLDSFPGVVQRSQYFDVTCKAGIVMFAKPGNR